MTFLAKIHNWHFWNVELKKFLRFWRRFYLRSQMIWSPIIGYIGPLQHCNQWDLMLHWLEAYSGTNLNWSVPTLSISWICFSERGDSFTSNLISDYPFLHWGVIMMYLWPMDYILSLELAYLQYWKESLLFTTVTIFPLKVQRWLENPLAVGFGV